MATQRSTFLKFHLSISMSRIAALLVVAFAIVNGFANPVPDPKEENKGNEWSYGFPIPVSNMKPGKISTPRYSVA
ncbi:hypothetical protein ONZ45_g4455 [Pleurotus djamor]|nr:hypothetical protein ONZ45_g4455 [Pleurotus djamor]